MNWPLLIFWFTEPVGMLSASAAWISCPGLSHSFSIPATEVSPTPAVECVLSPPWSCPPPPLVVVTVFDKAEAAASFAIVQELRAAGIRAEAYVGNGKMGDQFKYADKRGAAIAVVEGPDERAQGQVTLKDLALGAELAKSVESRADWVGNREAQKSVARAGLADAIKAMLKGRS